MSASLLDPPAGMPVASPTVAEPSADKLAAVGDLADGLGLAVHALQRARTQVLAHGGDGATDWNTRVVLAKIVMTGPKRVSELAETMQTDASTVSRQVAAMVKDGLLERQADPGDGRASLLVATDRGREAMERFKAGRTRLMAQMLETWSPEECAQFARLLERFTDDLQHHTNGTTTSVQSAADAAAKE